MEEKNHIYPIFDRMMTREDKEELLGCLLYTSDAADD